MNVSNVHHERRRCLRRQIMFLIENQNNFSFPSSPDHQKWKKSWFVLYPASQNGIARLEFFDSHSSGGGGGGGGSASGSNEKSRKLDKKIIRLSECISILPALMESCPKDNMSAFCVETNEKTYVFAAEKSATKDWMDTMCDIAFQVSSRCFSPLIRHFGLVSSLSLFVCS